MLHDIIRYVPAVGDGTALLNRGTSKKKKCTTVGLMVQGTYRLLQQLKDAYTSRTGASRHKYLLRQQSNTGTLYRTGSSFKAHVTAGTIKHTPYTLLLQKRKMDIAVARNIHTTSKIWAIRRK